MDSNVTERTMNALALLDEAMASGDVGAQRQAMSLVVKSIKESNEQI